MRKFIFVQEFLYTEQLPFLEEREKIVQQISRSRTRCASGVRVLFLLLEKGVQGYRRVRSLPEEDRRFSPSTCAFSAGGGPVHKRAGMGLVLVWRRLQVLGDVIDRYYKLGDELITIRGPTGHPHTRSACSLGRRPLWRLHLTPRRRAPRGRVASRLEVDSVDRRSRISSAALWSGPKGSYCIDVSRAKIQIFVGRVSVFLRKQKRFGGEIQNCFYRFRHPCVPILLPSLGKGITTNATAAGICSRRWSKTSQTTSWGTSPRGASPGAASSNLIRSSVPSDRMRLDDAAPHRRSA